MAACPCCGCYGADVFLVRVFCTNKNCQWYDEVQAGRVEKAEDRKDLARRAVDAYLDAIRLDPDFTPTYQPKKP